MVRLTERFLGVVFALWSMSGLEAGTISGSIRNLNGSPIADQANRTLTIRITTSQGVRLEAVRLPNGAIRTNDRRIALTIDTPDENDPDKITYRVTLDDGLFAGSANSAIVAEASLAGRVSPGVVRNIVGTSNSSLHLAFPRPEEVASIRHDLERSVICEPYCYRPCQFHQRHCRW